MVIGFSEKSPESFDGISEARISAGKTGWLFIQEFANR